MSLIAMSHLTVKPEGSKGVNARSLTDCPYCNADASQAGTTWYFNCENGHTYHADDYDGIIEGTKSLSPNYGTL